MFTSIWHWSSATVRWRKRGEGRGGRKGREGKGERNENKVRLLLCFFFFSLSLSLLSSFCKHSQHSTSLTTPLHYKSTCPPKLHPRHPPRLEERLPLPPEARLAVRLSDSYITQYTADSLASLTRRVHRRKGRQGHQKDLCSRRW